MISFKDPVGNLTSDKHNPRSLTIISQTNNFPSKFLPFKDVFILQDKRRHRDIGEQGFEGNRVTSQEGKDKEQRTKITGPLRCQAKSKVSQCRSIRL